MAVQHAVDMAAKAGQDALIAAVEQTEAWCKRYREHQTFIKCVLFEQNILLEEKKRLQMRSRMTQWIIWSKIEL